MIERFEPDLLQWYRSAHVDGEDAELNKHIGHFLTFFSIAEFAITHVFAYVLNMGNLERFDFVVRGLDPREKCSRLRSAAKAYKPLGPIFQSELELFEQDCIKTRNNLAHSWPMLDKGSGLVLFSTTRKLQTQENRPKSLPPPKDEGIHIDDLLSQAMWLNLFSSDVYSALDQAIGGGILEISDERLHQRPEVRLRSQRKAQKANPDKQGPAPPQSEGG